MANDLVEKIRNAVASLDHGKDEDWTAAGLPNVARVKEIVGDPSVTRADINAACPGVERKAEPQADGAALNILDEEGSIDEATMDAVAAAQTAVPVTPPGPASDAEMKATDATDKPDMTRGQFLMRGHLMAVIMGLPKPMRIVADATMLDDMAAFVATMGELEDQMIAVEMIKSIAETNKGEIPSGRYKERVEVAMAVVRGEIDHVQTVKTSADDREAAAARLRALTGEGAAPPPGYVPPSALAEQEAGLTAGADSDQVAAHARLYGGNPGSSTG